MYSVTLVRKASQEACREGSARETSSPGRRLTGGHGFSHQCPPLLFVTNRRLKRPSGIGAGTRRASLPARPPARRRLVARRQNPNPASARKRRRSQSGPPLATLPYAAVLVAMAAEGLTAKIFLEEGVAGCSAPMMDTNKRTDRLWRGSSCCFVEAMPQRGASTGATLPKPWVQRDIVTASPHPVPARPSPASPAAQSMLPLPVWAGLRTK